MRKRLAIITCLLLTGCLDTARLAPEVPVLLEASTGHLDAALLQRGRAVYLGVCTDCHSPVNIRRYSKRDWFGDILPEMSHESKLDSQDREALTAYIRAVMTIELPTDVTAPD